MKIAFIIVLYKTPQKEVDRLHDEIKNLSLKDYKLYFIDNIKNNHGYAAGVNTGISRGLKDEVDIFVMANPDISLYNLRGCMWLDVTRHFDIGGLAMKQGRSAYYGGKIDPWQLSGGMIREKPSSRFAGTDFVSGSLMIIKREVVEKIGLFDESYFMYYEDVDYCIRAKSAGFKVGIDSQATYEHFEQSRMNADKERMLANSHKKFQQKYGNICQKLYQAAKRVLTSRFLISFFSLNLSSLGIKLLNFINFLFLVRFLTVPEYGIYTLVWAQVGLLSPLVDFGTTSYGVVNLATEKENRFHSLVNLRFFLSMIVFCLTIIIALILFNNNFKIQAYILVTSVAIFSNMASGSYFIWNAIREKIYISSRNSLIFNFLLVLSIITSLFFFRRLLVVFTIIFIFYGIYTAVNFMFLRQELHKFILKFSLKDWLGIIKKSYIFVLIGFFAELYFNLDVFLLKILKGESAVGIYSAGYKFFDALLFLAASYNVTAAPVFAKLVKSSRNFATRVKKDLLFMTVLGTCVVFGVYLLAPRFLPLILKGNYQLSIPVLQVAIFALPLVLINSIFLNILYVLKKAYLVIFVFMAQTVLNFMLNYVFIPHYSFMASAVITVFSELSNLLILIILTCIVWKHNYENSH